MPQSGFINEMLSSALQPGDTFRLRVISSSMRPTLRPGDWVTARVEPSDQLRVGDLLVFQRGAELITHRLVDRREGFLLKGDATWGFDPSIQTDAILGRVIAVERGGLTQCRENHRMFDSLVAIFSRWTGRWHTRLAKIRNQK